MSMLSVQRDTLRVAADALEDEGVMPDCAKLLRDAADTIWQLRNDCVELRNERDRLLRAADGLVDTYRLRGRHYRDLYYDAAAENAKLRQERDYLWMNANPTAHELRTVRAQWKKDREDNDKLREALAYAFKTECAGKPTECETCKEQCPFSRIGVLMDELGIEVKQ